MCVCQFSCRFAKFLPIARTLAEDIHRLIHYLFVCSFSFPNPVHLSPPAGGWRWIYFEVASKACIHKDSTAAFVRIVRAYEVINHWQSIAVQCGDSICVREYVRILFSCGAIGNVCVCVRFWRQIASIWCLVEISGNASIESDQTIETQEAERCRSNFSHNIIVSVDGWIISTFWRTDMLHRNNTLAVYCAC